MKDEKKFEYYIHESSFPFTGWDFSHIRDRMRMAPMPWSYSTKILFYIKNSSSLLDMGTGGGEFLSSLQNLPKETHATEGYGPNVQLAKERLEDLGVKIHQVRDNSNLPFNDSFFDLIINRHESYDPKEVYRILKDEGTFITQQVGELDNLQINMLLVGKPEASFEGWNINYATEKLEEVGFTIIEKKEDFPITRIYDIGALIYYLKAIPWQIEDFSIEKYKENLRKIHKKIESEEYLDVQSHRFLIVAKKM